MGWSEVTVFQETEEGLQFARETINLTDVKDLNRQRITDTKNNLRREGDTLEIEKKVIEGKATPEETMRLAKKLFKQDSEMQKQLSALLKKKLA